MRICGGAAKGIPLQIPRANDIRPATEGNRERLFSSLKEKICGAFFLDLFAGTGSYGLEALSRGAIQGEFVENNRRAIISLKKNLTEVCKSAQLNKSAATIVNRDVMQYLKTENKSFDLIFLDPPYPLFPQLGSKIFQKIRQNKLLNLNGFLLHEAPPEAKSQFDGWNLTRTIGKVKKGSPSFRFFTLKD